MIVVNAPLFSMLVDGGQILAMIEDERVSRTKEPNGQFSNDWCTNIAEKLGAGVGELIPVGASEELADREDPHHLQHAVSAYIQSPFEDASILVIDGSDQESKFAVGIFDARGDEIRLVKRYPVEYSLGILYTAATCFSGLTNCGHNAKHNVGKLMGLSSYCSTDFYLHPEHYLQVNARTGDIEPGSLTYEDVLRLFTHKFGLRQTEKFSFEYASIAGYTQHLFEKSVFNLLNFMWNNLPSRNLIITGGCGLNCVTNGKVLRSGFWENLYVPPLCDDAGITLGSAYMQGLIKAPKRTFVYNSIKHGLPKGIPYREVSAEAVASSLKMGVPVAWFEGGSEYGPRALCHRSILGNPEYAWMSFRINQTKNRDYWRPLAPVVLDTHFSKVFISSGYKEIHKYMLATEFLYSKAIAKYPAIVAPNSSSRPQVLVEDNKETATLYRLMKDYDLPVLINTSLNDRNEPICETVEEAYFFCEKALIPLVMVHQGKLYILGGHDQ